MQEEILDMSAADVLMPAEYLDEAEKIETVEKVALKDPIQWQRDIRKVAIENGITVAEANRIVKEEAPLDLLKDWLNNDEDNLFEGGD